MNPTTAVWLPVAVSGTLAVVSAPLARRIPPRTAVRLLTGAAVVCTFSTACVLAVLGADVLGQLPVVARSGQWSSAELRSTTPVAADVRYVSAVAVVVLVFSTLHRTVHIARGFARAGRVCRRLGPGVAGLVVIEDDTPDAYALPTLGVGADLGGRVVVSTSMLRALTGAERSVLLAHESAHVRHRHHLYVALARVAAAGNPLLLKTAEAVTVATERWADEVAAQEVGDRRLAATALARAAVARASVVQGRRSATFARLPAASSDNRLVLDRARALLQPPPHRRRALTSLVTAVLLCASLAAAVTASSTEDRFELAHSTSSTSR